MDEIRYHMSRQGWNDAPFTLVSPEEIKLMVPPLDIDGAGVKFLLLKSIKITVQILYTVVPCLNEVNK